MAESIDPKEIKSIERKAGRKAAKMAEQYLLNVIKGKLNIRNEGFPEGPIMEDTTVKAVMGDFRLKGLNLQSSKAAFILNYGFTGVREATTVYYKASRYNISKTQRKAHNFHLPPQDIFADFYLKSGSIDFLVGELSKTRTGQLQHWLDHLAVKFKFDKQDGEQ